MKSSFKNPDKSKKNRVDPAKGAKTKKVVKRKSTSDPVVEEDAPAKKRVRKKIAKEAEPAIQVGSEVMVHDPAYEEPYEATVKSLKRKSAVVVAEEEDEDGNPVKVEETVKLEILKLSKSEIPDANAKVVDEEEGEEEGEEEEAGEEGEEGDEEEEALVTRDDNTELARFAPDKVGYTGGEVSADMYERPILGISYGVGALHEDHDWEPGALVLGNEAGLYVYGEDSPPIELIVLAWEVQYTEKLEDYDENIQPRTFRTGKEARDAGLRTSWIKGEDGKNIKPNALKGIAALILVKEPETICDQEGNSISSDLFNIEYGEDTYAMCYFYLKNMAYDYAKGKFLNAAPRTGPHHWTLTMELNYWKRKGGKRKIHVPVIKRKDKRKKNDPEFIEFLESLL